ncbi:DUF3320 domain-containing protein [Paenibacillus koleovorans]|uniref:DUF3320 domain-containing protein n=1 Tax=Paenibacillus koleovorans TaxID=121608 RepID=UPI0013E2D395|nr:DUF3320 domain-containing protein [Paenibacillus koleovorans]
MGASEYITFIVEYGRTVNYAWQQNHVPVIRRLRIRNNGAEKLEQVTVAIGAEPEFGYAWSRTLEELPAGQTVDLGAIDYQLSAPFLVQLTERLAGVLKVTARSGGRVAGGEVLPIDVLAFDEWSGLAVLPEMIAAFVLPNHPEVAPLLREASDILGDWSGSPAFDAYQSQNPNRARMQAAAIYAAIQKRHLTYSVAPASFELIGQRVRLPDSLFRHRMGNCLDLSLFYAACLEAVGLHPLLVFTEGHAFAGVWLTKETFAESVQDDGSLLTKRLAPGVHELCVVEATALAVNADRRGLRFEQAEQAAQELLQDERKFDCFVDVRRARASSIRPLPLRVSTPEGWKVEPDAAASADSPENGFGGDGQAAPLAPSSVNVHMRPEEVRHIAMPKQKEWERKLLDLTLRNGLLHFRMTRSSLPLLTANLSDLEDRLSADEEFQLLPLPADWTGSLRDADLYRRVNRNDPVAELVKQEFEQRRLRADMTDKELTERLTHLYRSARVSLEENGANTLFLALGLLKWYETNVSEKARYAPLVLLPVELLKKTSRTGYILRRREDEIQFNITLLEMLKQDFGIEIGGMDPLPKDERGVDLSRIFTMVRHAVMSKSRWDVLETGCLGLFSFSQFVMWNDIRSRSGELARNKVVASLMAGSLRWTPEPLFPYGDDLDAQYAPKQLAVPVSADSSQLAAIAAAGEGKSFVLHGPPGTGKSQTITNMIAGALANGKTVLFVAEKMAALNVVQRRLAQIGLDPFCLELHSNKSKKKVVLDQLRMALETTKTASSEEWSREAGRLAQARAELNEFVQALHSKEHSHGLSVYEALTRFNRVRTMPDVVDMPRAKVKDATPEQLQGWLELARQLIVAGTEAGGVHRHPLQELGCEEYSPSLKNELESKLAAYAAKLAQSEQALGQAVDALRLGALPEWPAAGGLTRQRTAALQELFAALASVPDIRAALVRMDEHEFAAAELSRLARHGRSRDELRRRVVAAGYDAASIATFDAAGALAAWQAAELQWFAPKWLGQNRIVKRLRSMSAGQGTGTGGATVGKEQVEEHLNLFLQWKQEEETLRQAEQQASAWLGEKLWNAGNAADWQTVEEAGVWLSELNRILARLAVDGPELGALRRQLAERFDGGRAAFLTQIGPLLQACLELTQQAEALQRELFSLLGVDVDALELQAAWNLESGGWHAFRIAKAEIWASNLNRLRDWCAYRRTRTKALEAGLDMLIEPYEEGRLAGDEAVSAFERALYQACAESMIAAHPLLYTFSSKLFEETIRRFGELSDRFEELTRQEIAARLSARIPQAAADAAQSSEMGILLRAIRSGGRSLSIRKLFEQIPNLLGRLCPCMLMSPISVAQYLDPATPPFDLVVFDEASQMPTSAAVGAMARGQSVVVVGDPKQLPPTSFFSSVNQDPSEEELATEDLESVLDDCLALGMPEGHLLWHYRSRHESLIAFSNRQYYENKLLTFPSPSELTSRVRLQHVSGTYDRGRTKTNRAEAEAVVGEIARRLSDPALQAQSIGVVTFNSVQQNLIEDMLDELLRRRPELEAAALQTAEPIFVKNLENVQGDERDVILFSIGYGPDSSGKVSMNFGPLNREGGWRRLNVAVSRARHEMIVFSTLKAEHLSSSRTGAVGVAGLKAFLEYAEKGRQALAIQGGDLGAGVSVAAGMEVQMADRLREHGYVVDTHVGSSGYRVDLAIVDPKDSTRYILGVVTDGGMYSGARSARDRDVLRDRVLRQLGWTLHKVWSLDWWDDPAREAERVVQAVKRVQLSSVSGAARELVETSGAVDQPTVEVSNREQAVAPPLAEKQGAAAAVSQVSLKPSAPVSMPSYRIHVLDPESGPADAFFSPRETRLIRSQIVEVIEEEGPISRALICRRVLQAWGIARMGAKLEQRFEELFAGVEWITTMHDERMYYWPPGIDPSGYDQFRPAEDENDRRSAEDLPPEEIAAAVRYVLAGQISLPHEDLVREVAKAFGYQRSGAALDRAIRTGIELAAERGVAAVDEQGRVVLKL